MGYPERNNFLVHKDTSDSTEVSLLKSQLMATQKALEEAQIDIQRLKQFYTGATGLCCTSECHSGEEVLSSNTVGELKKNYSVNNIQRYSRRSEGSMQILEGLQNSEAAFPCMEKDDRIASPLPSPYDPGAASAFLAQSNFALDTSARSWAPMVSNMGRRQSEPCLTIPTTFQGSKYTPPDEHDETTVFVSIKQVCRSNLMCSRS